MPDSIVLSQTTTSRKAHSKFIRIAYIGADKNMSLHRAKAMQRLGHNVTIIDPIKFLPKSKWTFRWLHYTGGFGVGALINDHILTAVTSCLPQLIWVNQGEFLESNLLKKLRLFKIPIVNYTNDDPFGGRDGSRFKRYLSALKFYDLLVVVRAVNVAEAYAHGARKVLHVPMTADEVEHRPRSISKEDIAKWSSEVCFAGAWMPERGPFMAELIREGIPLSIWGNSWQKAPEWDLIKPYWRGPAELDPEIYCRIIQLAKICIGLLSKGNRDKHTTRSMEIPALGGLLCAERTDEHLALYTEGEEAVYWDNAKECAEKCHRLLEKEAEISRIKNNAVARARLNGNFNETVISRVFSIIEQL